MVENVDFGPKVYENQGKMDEHVDFGPKVHENQGKMGGNGDLGPKVYEKPGNFAAIKSPGSSSGGQILN